MGLGQHAATSAPAGASTAAGTTTDATTWKGEGDQTMSDDEEIQLTPEAWEAICAMPDGEIEFLHVGEDGGMAAAIAWLDERNLAWRWIRSRRERRRGR